MNAKLFIYPVIIKETYLDIFGHMNHATYLTLFEDARWEWVTQGGYGLKKMMATGIGPVVLEVKICYLKELRLRDEIVIETQFISFEGKIGKFTQKMVRASEVCCTAEFTFGLFDIKERKLILPTPEWIQAIAGEVECKK